MELLGELEQSSVGVDTTAYNCVLDVCIKCGDKRAVADLFTKMKVTESFGFGFETARTASLQFRSRELESSDDLSVIRQSSVRGDGVRGHDLLQHAPEGHGRRCHGAHGRRHGARGDARVAPAAEPDHVPRAGGGRGVNRKRFSPRIRFNSMYKSTFM